ncbi:MAG TPA: TonB-dependent receptor [Chitinophagaceae bacterium]|nr:MAG: TonB-dependent receptor [Bacteroidetes bacterium OLB11]HMN32204.1 TonB-dependent receptor [Chitinophagaceae bacterium]
MKKIICFAFSILASNLFALSQTKDNSIQDTIRNIELPASYIIAQKSITSKMFKEQAGGYFDKKTIQKFNQGQDIPYLLNSISSVVSCSDAGAGVGYTGIRIRGADITRINVTLNGVPVNDAESQATFFVNTPDLLSSSQQIEVSKGIGNSKNGVGNFGAGIGINNLDVDYQNPSVSYSFDMGSFHTFKNTLKVSTGLIDNKLVATIRLSKISSDGYIERSSSDLKALQTTIKYLISPSSQLIFNMMKGSERTGQAWNGVPHDSLATHRTFNELGIMSNGNYYQNQTDNYAQDYYQLFFDKKVNSFWSIGSTLFLTKGQGYYEQYKIGQKYKNYGLSNYQPSPDTIITKTDMIRQLWLKNNFYGARFYALYLKEKLNAGIYLNLNQYDGKHFGEIIWAQQGVNNHYRWYDLWASKTDANIYSMLEYKPTQTITLFGDLQYRNVNYLINGFRDNPTIQHNLVYHFFNPKIKATYKQHQTFVSLLVGMTQKEPNRDDIEASEKELPKHETLYDIELSLMQKIKSQFVIQANLFGMYYKDQLALTGQINDVGAYTRSNIDESYRYGIELELRYKSQNGLLEANGNIALSQNKMKAFTEYIDDYDQDIQIKNTYHLSDISFSPNVIVGGRLSIFPLRKSGVASFNNLSLDILPKYVGKQYLDNTSNENRKLNPYFISDVLLQIPFQLENKSLFNIRLGVYNIFNNLYSSNGYTYSYISNSQLTTQNYYFPQSGIRWMLGAQFSF